MKAFLLGANPSFDVAKTTSSSERLSKTGGNTGNQIIAKGLLDALALKAVSWDFSIGPQRVAEEFDIVLIAAANFIFPGFDFGGMADFIEQTKLPCAIVGLGAQSKDYTVNIPLKPGTERFLQVVADRAHTIGVRGPFTADVLSKRNIKNVQVTGCPSHYMTGKPDLNVINKPLSNLSRVMVNSSRDVIGHAFDREKMKYVVKSLMAQAVQHNAKFVAQSEMDEIRIADNQQGEERASALENLTEFYNGVSDVDTFKRWAEKSIRAYWSVDEWSREATESEFVVGTRFHGAMIAIQGGTPAMVICHDTRTTEMCQFLGMPYRGIVDIESLDIRTLRESVDLDHLHSRYKELYPAYKDFLAKNNLPSKLT